MVNTWSNQLTGALEGLALGDLPLDASLRQALSALDPARMQSLTPEQAAELAKRLAQSGGKLSALQLGKPGGTPSGQATSCTNGAAVFAGQPGTGGSGTGPGTGSGTTPGEGPGAGGVSRGPGTAPLSFTQNPSEVGSTAQEQLSNPDMRHASPGEITGLTQGQHEVDRNAWQGSAAGGAAGTGQGGETVWMESLTPDERDVLKQYYR
jgi:hypothetical protein